MSEPTGRPPTTPEDQLRARLANLERIEQRLLAVSRELELERAMFMAGPVMLLRWGKAEPWPVEFVSRNVWEILGFSDQRLMAEHAPFLAMAHPDDRDRVADELTRAIDGGLDKFTHRPYRLIASDGRTVWVRDHTTIIRDQHGHPENLVGYLVDISELIETQQKLTQSQERLAFALDGARDGVWDWDATTGRVFHSPRWKEMLGHQDDEVSDDMDQWERRLHPDDRAEAMDRLRRHLRGESPYYESQHRLRRKDGSYLWVLDRGKAVTRDAAGRPRRVIGTISDIGERKRAQETLEHIFSLSLDMLCVGGFDGYLKELNPSWRRQLGWDNHELTAKPWIDFVHPDDRAATNQATNRLTQGRPLMQFQNRMLCKDGGWRWLSWNSFPRMDQRLIYAVARDVTSQKAAEAALAESEERFRQLVENISEVFWIMEADSGRVLYVNQAYAQVWGRDSRELYQNPDALFAAVHQADRPALDEALTRLGDQRAPLNISYRIDRPDGQQRWIWARTFPIRDHHGVVYRWAGVAEDITRQKTLEQELTQLATTDSLTGACNRLRFMERLAEEFGRACRYNRPLSLCMLDIDHFKRVNDGFGHAAGDLVLRRLTSVCRELLRENDVLGRIGGEEFALILPETDCQGARQVAERLRAKVAAMRVETDRGPIGLTVSLGVAQRGASDPDLETLLRRADDALYQAKRRGRDRVVAAANHQPPNNASCQV